jgi:hypothetical protein
MDGEHKRWIILEAENKEQARQMLPPANQNQAKRNRFRLITIKYNYY